MGKLSDNKFLFDPSDRVRMIFALCTLIWITTAMIILFYPTIPIEVELSGTGILKIPSEKMPNNMTFELTSLNTKFKTIVPAVSFIPTINTLSGIYNIGD